MYLYSEKCSDVIVLLVIYSHCWLNFGVIMRILEINLFRNLLPIIIHCRHNFWRAIWVYLVASSKFSFGNWFSLVFTFEWTAFIPSLDCNLLFPSWVSVAFLPREEIIAPSGENALYFCDMSHIVCGVGFISSQEYVYAAFTSMAEGSVVEMFSMTRVLAGVLALVRCLLTVWLLWANVMFFCCCHSLLFLRLSLVVFEREPIWRQSSLQVPLFSKDAPVVPRATSIVLNCGFWLSTCC